jgi:two-component system sensor histidine kinase KdpD
MKKHRQLILDGIFTFITLILLFAVNLIIEIIFDTRTLIPMIFVLGVFLVSLKTQGYFWGITASLLSVLAVNYAFTFPYYAFDLISPECIFSAVVMLIVAIMTGALTTQLKTQEKIKAESEMERMRANLLRAVSHDLRTPLTSIYGSTSAVIENYDNLSKEQNLKLLGDVQKDSQWLIHLVENLLSVTRIDSSKVSLSKTTVVLEELIDSVLVKFKKRCPEQEVIVEIPDDFVSIPMDPILIEQVLLNIMENAVYHAKGMTELRLKVEIKEKKAVFSVKDNGCGISPDVKDKIFNGYISHSDAPTDGSRNNMGIGLSVCSTIVHAHGGTIHAENLEEGGAIFYFVLEAEENNEQ